MTQRVEFESGPRTQEEWRVVVFKLKVDSFMGCIGDVDLVFDMKCPFEMTDENNEDDSTAKPRHRVSLLSVIRRRLVLFCSNQVCFASLL